MNFRFIDIELQKLGLKIIPINALVPDRGTYSVLLNQFKGELVVTDSFIGNSDSSINEVHNKFKSFFQLSFNNKIDLIISPEYSCPWQALQLTATEQVLPEANKIWILGMESITPAQLKKFVLANNQIVWIYDEELLEISTTKVVLDAVCILFKVQNAKGESKDACVVQFKNTHMSVHSPGLREVDLMIEGRFMYVIRNEGSTINLLTLICSDSLAYKHEDLLNARLNPLLLVHIQMNLDPRHSVFKRYRNDIFNGESRNIELICLNWAKESKVVGHDIHFSGTTYFSKSEKPLLEDTRINKNQESGIFYSFWKGKQSHLFFYPSADRLFSFNTHKASQELEPSPQLRKREGPMASSFYRWNGEQYKYETITPPQKDFANYCLTLNSDLSPIDELSYIDKERLVKLTGAINLAEDCFEITKFDNFSVDDSELIHRLTYTDEIDVAVKQVKETSLLNFKELVNIFKNHKVKFPAELKLLVTDTQLTYNNQSHPFFNVYTNDQKLIGTIVYLGSSVPDKAKRVYNYLLEIITKINSKKSIGIRPLLAVWYTDNGLKSYYHVDKSIDLDLSETDLSITK